MAIITYKEISVRIIPDGLGSSVMLQAGTNEVNDEIWGRVRQHVLDLIGTSKKKEIEEHGVTSKIISELVDGPEIMETIDNKEVGTGKFEKVEKETQLFIVASKKINQLDKSKAVELIGRCFSIPLLNSWLSGSENQILTNAMNKQIKHIEEHGGQSSTEDKDED